LETYIARQPIFGPRRRVFGYELFFRSGLENVFTHPDPNQATSKVMVDSFLLFNVFTLTGGKKAFINTPRDILLSDFLFLFPRELIVAEILESVEPDAAVIAALKKLKKAGYLLAVDDFVYSEKTAPFLELADFIKVDFLKTPLEERKALPQRIHSKKTKLIAEKVETPEMFQEGLELGYHYFQGYFFSKPKILTGKDIPGYKTHYLQILQEIHRPEMDLEKLEDYVKREVSIAYKLLRYINSAFFSLPHKINSIKQALMLLGEKRVRNWISLVAMAGMGADKPEELAVWSIVRAKFCETLGPSFQLDQRADDLFLMGLLSLIDAFLDRPLPDILQEIPIQGAIKDALLGEKNPLLDVYLYTLDYEKGSWEEIAEHQSKFAIEEYLPLRLYLEAVQWGQRCFPEEAPEDNPKSGKS
jgi:c-di-GMP-related signal transduction protein